MRSRPVDSRFILAQISRVSLNPFDHHRQGHQPGKVIPRIRPVDRRLRRFTP